MQDTNDQRTSEILRKVRQVEIRTNRMVTDALSGAYHSVFKGQGIDFEEVREYEPGDDVRSIDWNVTARMDRPFVKLFREERELTLMLAVDLSASGGFGSSHQAKRELAAEIASVLAFSASRNNDKVGLLLFTDKVELLIPPRKGRQHILRVIREILFFQPSNKGTDIGQAVESLNRLLRRKAAVFILSDFIESSPSPAANATAPASLLSEPTQHALRLCANRHDLTAILIADRHESTLPDIGRVLLEDAETAEVIELDTGSPSVRHAYASFNERRHNALRRALRQHGIGLLETQTDQPYISALQRYFETRGARRH